MLWLPRSLPDARFAALSAGRREDANPMLLHESPAELAIRFRRQAGAVAGPVPVIAIETLEEGQLRDALRQGCDEVMAGLVEPREWWPFFGSEQFEKQLRHIEGGRAIVAVHDLNTGRARSWREAREAVESKVKGHQQRADLALRKHNQQMDLFWTVLLVDKAEQLPFVKSARAEAGERHPPAVSRRSADAARPVVPDPERPRSFAPICATGSRRDGPRPR